MAHLVLFRPEVGAGVVAGAGTAGDAFDYADAGFFELLDLVGIIREEADGADAQRFQCFGGEIVVARVGGKAQFAIGFDGVETLVLQLVGFYFVEQADAAAFLWKVEHDAGAVFGDFAQREF